MKNTSGLKKQILLNLPYVLIFWFANKLGMAYRLAPGKDFAEKVMGLMESLNKALSNPLPSFHPQDLLFGIIGTAVIFFVVWNKKKNAKKWRKNAEYGSACWGTSADIRPFMDKDPENNIILTATEGLTMNPRPPSPKYARNKNMLVIGGSGSGKTRFVLKPNLMQCRSKTYPVSFVVTDPKASILTECGRMLRRYGYRIKVFNTINFKKSQHYNPFSYIRSEKDILKLVMTLIANTKGEKKGGDEFWEKSEILLYTALIAYLHYESPAHERNFATLAEMIGAMEVREEDETFKNVIDLMFDRLAEKDPDHFAVRQYRKFKLAAGVVSYKRLINQFSLKFINKELIIYFLCAERSANMRENKITALYERLSVDDGQTDNSESNSIQNQKIQLEEYAKAHGFTNIVHYTDDGESGVFFDRAGYTQMMADIENGRVAVCICKDISRIGRDYIRVGLCMETMRINGVRLIALNDGIDTLRGEDDFTPFRNVMHEFYAKDTSKKIKSVFRAKGMSGKHVTGTVAYGYMWDEKREKWLIDEEAAEVVRSIFRMTIEGYGPYQISQKLTEQGVLIPAAHMARFNEGVNKNKKLINPCGWGSSTIQHILKKREYLGHTCNFKTRKHFKDKKSRYVDESEWTIFENTHEPIIDQDTYDNAQRLRGNARRYPDGFGEAHPLTGLMYCADCGGKMYVHRTSNGKRIPQYTCAEYGKVPVGVLCLTQHRINAEVVLLLIADMLRAIADYSKNDRAAFVKAVTNAQDEQQNGDITKKKKRLVTAQQRAGELEKLICKIYEDSILGKLPEARYAALDEQYAKEQTALSKEISEIEAAVNGNEKSRKSADKFIALVEKYENFDTLTTTMLNEFVEKILVHERDRKGSIETTQQVEIFFNFVGRYVPPHFGEVNYTPEEREELRKKEERKDRLHQNYLRRKERGKVAEDYEKTKAKKKAEMDAKKNALRAEDIAKGVFIPVSAMPKTEPKKAVKTKTDLPTAANQ